MENIEELEMLLTKLLRSDEDTLRINEIVESCDFFDLLETSCIEGYENIINEIVTSENVNAKFSDNSTLLMKACLGDNINIIKKLIELGIDINAQNDQGYTAIMFASMGDNADIVEFLIKNGAIVNLQENLGFIAINFTDNEEIAKLLISGGCMISKSVLNKTTNQNISTIINEGLKFLNAGKSKDIELVKKLINENSYFINVYDEYGFNLLHYACAENNYDFAKFLIEKGGNIIYNRDDLLKTIFLKNYTNIINLLVESKIYTKEDFSALCSVADISMNNKEFIKTIQDHLDFFDACKNGDLSKIKYILSNNNNININAQNENGENCVFLAIISQNYDAVKYLLNLGVDLNVINKDGHMGIHYACYNKHDIDTIKFLIENNAVVDESVIEYCKNDETKNLIEKYLEELHEVEYGTNLEYIAMKKNEFKIINIKAVEKIYEIACEQENENNFKALFALGDIANYTQNNLEICKFATEKLYEIACEQENKNNFKALSKLGDIAKYTQNNLEICKFATEKLYEIAYKQEDKTSYDALYILNSIAEYSQNTEICKFAVDKFYEIIVNSKDRNNKNAITLLSNTAWFSKDSYIRALYVEKLYNLYMEFDNNYNKELIKDNLNHVMYNIEYQDTRELIKDKLKLIKQQLETKRYENLNKNLGDASNLLVEDKYLQK